MRGSFGRWLSTATVVMLAALVAFSLALILGLARADRLLDRSGRSQAQLALAYRLEADSLALMTPDPLRLQRAGPALDADLVRYRQSIDAESRKLGPAARAGQATEADRADQIDRLARRMRQEAGPLLAADAARFQLLVHAIVQREQGEARAALEEMHALRRRATPVAIALPALLAIIAAWAIVTMRGRLLRPLARLRDAAAGIGSGQVDTTSPGFVDFVPLGDAIIEADREIVRQRTALAQANGILEAQVAERTSALAQQNERLATIDATRRLFFSQVGHELRTPITVIRGEAEVVLRDPAASADRLRESLDHIVTMGAFLGRRIDDLLAVARAEDGRLTIARRPLDLVALVVAVERIAAPYARSAEVSLTVQTPDQPLPFDGDASWVQQALLALIDNAVRHAARGGGRIRLLVEQAADATIVTVADNGPGVPAELLPRLFAAWYQADGTSGGSGLGMAVAHWVAQAHGGTIEACNAATGGLVVTMRFPAP